MLSGVGSNMRQRAAHNDSRTSAHTHFIATDTRAREARGAHDRTLSSAREPTVIRAVKHDMRKTIGRARQLIQSAVLQVVELVWLLCQIGKGEPRAAGVCQSRGNLPLRVVDRLVHVLAKVHPSDRLPPNVRRLEADAV